MVREVVMLALILLSIVSLFYAAMGIITAHQWPDPHCCCYRGHRQGRDRITDILTSINILLGLQVRYRSPG